MADQGKREKGMDARRRGLQSLSQEIDIQGEIDRSVDRQRAILFFLERP